MTIGDIIKKYRELHGLTIDEFVKNSKLTKGYISMLENNLNPSTGKPIKPSVTKTKIIADIMGLSLTEILEMVDESTEITVYEDEKKDDLSEDEINTKKSKGIKIPVLGKVVAGVPIDAIEEVIDYEEITPELANTGTFFALKIQGASMEPRIVEGDIVIVKQQSDIENGDIAIVLVNGNEATVKKVNKQDNGILLSAFNPSVYTPTFYNNKQIEELPVQIIGKVIELIGKF